MWIRLIKSINVQRLHHRVAVAADWLWKVLLSESSKNNIISVLVLILLLGNYLLFFNHFFTWQIINRRRGKCQFLRWNLLLDRRIWADCRNTPCLWCLKSQFIFGDFVNIYEHHEKAGLTQHWTNHFNFGYHIEYCLTQFEQHLSVKEGKAN